MGVLNRKRGVINAEVEVGKITLRLSENAIKIHAIKNICTKKRR